MDHLEILQSTGGLPPSAFTLETEHPPDPFFDAERGFLKGFPSAFADCGSTDCEDSRQPVSLGPESTPSFLSTYFSSHIVSSSPAQELPPVTSPGHFVCTDTPPCELSFTKSERLANHIT